MDNTHIRSIVTVALMAAFADGLKDERERDAIAKLAEALGAEASIDLPAWYRDVLLTKPDLAAVVVPVTPCESAAAARRGGRDSCAAGQCHGGCRCRRAGPSCCGDGRRCGGWHRAR
jgi:hypothetical protein